jgi:hypothetical protein
MLDLSQFDDPIDFEDAISAAFHDAAFATAAVAKLDQIKTVLEQQRDQFEHDLMVAETPQAAAFFARCAIAESAGFNAAIGYN